MSFQALVALAENAFLNAAFPSKVPRLPPCQIGSSDQVSSMTEGFRLLTAWSMKR
jgi:hypothetical protein